MLKNQSSDCILDRADEQCHIAERILQSERNVSDKRSVRLFSCIRAFQTFRTRGKQQCFLDYSAFSTLLLAIIPHMRNPAIM